MAQIHFAFQRIEFGQQLAIGRIFGQFALDGERVLLQPPQLGDERAQLVLYLLDGPALVFGAGQLQLEAEPLQTLAGLLPVRLDVQQQIVDNIQQHFVLERIGANVQIVMRQRERIDRMLALRPQIHHVVAGRRRDVHRQRFQVVVEVQRVLAVADVDQFAVAARDDPLQLEGGRRRIASADRLRNDSADTLAAADHIGQVVQRGDGTAGTGRAGIGAAVLPGAADVVGAQPQDVLVQRVLFAAGADGGKVLHPVQRTDPGRLRHQTAVAPDGRMQPLQDFGVSRTDDDVAFRFATFQQNL